MKSAAIISAIALTASAAEFRVAPRQTPAPSPAAPTEGQLTECQSSALEYFQGQPAEPTELAEFSADYYKSHTRTASVTEDDCAYFTAIPESIDPLMAAHYVEGKRYEEDNAEQFAAAMECLAAGGDAGVQARQVPAPPVGCGAELGTYYSDLSENYDLGITSPEEDGDDEDLTACRESAVALFEGQPVIPTDLANFSSLYYETNSRTAGATATEAECAYITAIPEDVDALLAEFYTDAKNYQADNAGAFKKVMECLGVGSGDVVTDAGDCADEWAAYRLELSVEYPDSAPGEETPDKNPEDCDGDVPAEGGGAEYPKRPEAPQESASPELESPGEEYPEKPTEEEPPIQAGASGLKIATVAAALISSVVGLALI